MSEPIWILQRAVIAMHERMLVEHGGPPGVRDEGLLESALARPRNLHAYTGTTDLPRLAAAYAAGITQNHPFVDGNKRSAFLTAFVFLRRNGLQLIAAEVEATRAVMALAAGDMPEEQFAAWLAANVRSV